MRTEFFAFVSVAATAAMVHQALAGDAPAQWAWSSPTNGTQVGLADYTHETQAGDVICVYTRSTATNDFAIIPSGLYAPAAGLRCLLKMTDRNGREVRKKWGTRRFERPVAQTSRIHYWKRNWPQPIFHSSSIRGMPLGMLHLSDLFKIKDPGKYTLTVEALLLQDTGKDILVPIKMPPVSLSLDLDFESPGQADWPLWLCGFGGVVVLVIAAVWLRKRRLGNARSRSPWH